jgi:hypothetical protein
LYKIFIRITATRTSPYLEEQSSLPAEQNRNHSGTTGCKYQLLTSKAIFEECRTRRKNITWHGSNIKRHLIMFLTAA